MAERPSKLAITSAPPMVIAILAAAGALRVAYASRCAVGYDEVFVVGVGLDEATRSIRDWLFDVPATRSNAITPLWWWLQSLPALATGQVSLFAMRAVSILIGVGGLWLTWRVARRRIGRGPATFLLLFAGLSGVLAFADARAEYVESLLVAAALPAACLVGDQRRLGLKIVLWSVLPMTHLGKGCFLLAGLVCAELIALMLRRGRGRDAFALGLVCACASLPVGVWLLLANLVVFADGAVMTDAGMRANVWDALAALTFGYDQTKPHMIARPLDAAQVYLDAFVWPTTSLMLVPMLAGLCGVFAVGGHGSPLGFAQGRQSSGTQSRGSPNRSSQRHGLQISDTRGRSPRGRWLTPNTRLALSLLPWIVLGAGYVIVNGNVGARFHLLYLPAVWVAGSIGLWRLRFVGVRALSIVGAVWLAHAGFAASVSDWLGRAWAFQWFTWVVVACVALGIGLTWALVRRRAPLSAYRPFGPSRRWRTGLAAGLGTCVAPMLLLAGPLQWGPAARFEPIATASESGAGQTLLEGIDAWRSGAGAYPADDDRTLYLAMAHYFLTAGPDQARGAFSEEEQSRNAARAAHYARLQTQSDPDDSRGWFYLGLTLQNAGAPVGEVRAAWEQAFELQPSEGLARRLEGLGE